jgi:hypothetical protein
LSLGVSQHKLIGGLKADLHIEINLKSTEELKPYLLSPLPNFTGPVESRPFNLEGVDFNVDS